MKAVYFWFICALLHAENITLEEAEKRFHESNLELIAGAFDVAASKDLISKERIWDNPNFAFQEGLKEINNQFQISQPIVIAKRSKRVGIAKLDFQIAGLEQQKTASSLKLELQRSFFTLFFLSRDKDFYEKSILALRKTVNAAERIYQKRLILLSEVMRLKSLLLTLETENLELLNKISEEHARFSILLGTESGSAIELSPVFEISKLGNVTLRQNLDELVPEVLSNRLDVGIAQKETKQEELNLSLQRSIWIPDINLQLSYQQAGNSVPDYFGLQLGFDVPLFNQNIAMARNSKNLLSAKQKREQQTLLAAKRDIQVAYEKAKQAIELLKHIDPSYLANYEQLAQDMTQNYQRGNIEIMAFADFYESYRDSITKMNQTLLGCALTFEEFNYAVGQNKIEL